MKSNRDSHLWKGDDAGLIAKHRWVQRQKGKPSLCEMCGTTTAKRFDWANKDHKYSRNLEDYMRLCASCHRKYDIKNNHIGNFFTSPKTKYIKCVDCKDEIERLTPNHKRCKDCGYEIAKQRARKASDNRGKEKNNEIQREWYYRNREKKIKQVMEYQRNNAPNK